MTPRIEHAPDPPLVKVQGPEVVLADARSDIERELIARWAEIEHLKNIVAIASGMADGLGVGDDTRALVITWGTPK